ncbi:MAG TPA: FHA domain-containing protein [Planctomycetes bacterium]|nr:FHA domain-containing protein [Planctomycetota bacterium]
MGEPMSGYLELPDGGFLGVKHGLVFGRVASCDVVVNDTKASRRHARLIVESGVVEIEDMDSSNGTLLNGKSIDRRMLRDGDEVRIGKAVIKYREGVLPGSQSKSRSSGASASIFEDDDDLFGDSSSQNSAPPAAASPAAVTPSPAPPPPPARPVTPPPAEPPAARPSDDLLDDGDDLLGSEPAPAKAPEPVQPTPVQPPPPNPAPTSGNVVEFEDEVVDVEKAPAAPPPARRASEAVVEVRKPRQDPPAAKAKPASGGAGEVSGTSGRILQYSKKAGGKSALGDDLGQMSGGMRLFVVLAVVAVGGGVVYGIMTAMQ